MKTASATAALVARGKQEICQDEAYTYDPCSSTEGLPELHLLALERPAPPPWRLGCSARLGRHGSIDRSPMRFAAVTYAYPRTHAPAVSDLTLSLAPGVTGLLGVNGAGKSTLMKLATGELIPTAGVIESGSDHAPGYCPQAPAFPPHFSVRETLTYLAWLRRIPKRERAIQVDQALAVAGLGERADARMRTLSGGMLRRVAIAQAFLGSPPVVLLDEPTTGLDPEQRVRCRELVRSARSSSSILLSSHLIEDVAELADRVLVIHEGRIVREFDQRGHGRPHRGGARAALPVDRHECLGMTGLLFVRSPRVWGYAALATAVCSFVLVSRGAPWRGEWLWTFDWVAGASILLGPVLAGAAAYEVATYRTFDLGLARPSARRRVLATVVPVLGPLAATVAPFVVGTTIAVELSWPLHPTDRFSPRPVLPRAALA